MLLILLPLAICFLVPALLPGKWLSAYVVVMASGIPILLDSSGRSGSNCGFCDAMADAYYMYLAVVVVAGLLARSVVGILRAWGLKGICAWLPMPLGLALVVALPLTLIG